MSISTNFNNYDGLPVQFAGLFELAILFLMFHIFKHTSSESGESGKHIKVKKKVFMKRRKKSNMLDGKIFHSHRRVHVCFRHNAQEYSS